MERMYLWGLEHSLNNDGTFHWQGSTSNVSGLAIHYCEQFNALECLSLTPQYVLCVHQSRLLTTAEQVRECYLLC